MIRPRLWVSPIRYGLGRTKPNHYLEIARTVWENRRDLPYAWRILSRGVCDGCALGVAGFHDWTMDGIHLCTTRLDLLRLNTARALDPAVLADVAALPRSSAALRALGRLPYPMHRRRGESGFRRVSWDEALALAAARIRESAPDRIGFYLTARGLTNEAYYAAQKVARFLGTNNIDNAARVCHAPSTGALRQAIGVAATTCSYRDVLESDLVVLFGADVANAQPVFMKYLYLARKRGTKVVVVNPFREPGLEYYWVPSSLESAVFGTKIADRFFEIHTGGDLAFVRGALKVLFEEGGEDEAFVRERTTGLAELQAALAERSLTDLAAIAGSSVADVREFARFYEDARSAVLVWSMGVTQHVCGTENVQGIVDLALARANVGRPGTGLMPIRGHSGVQGGAEMGAYATALPGGLPINAQTASALSARYGFAVPPEHGLSAAEMVEAAGRDGIDVLWSSGGNFLETLPDPTSVENALARVPLRVHHHRASRRAEPRDPRSACRRGASRVGDIRGARTTGLPRASRSDRARIGRADPRGNRVDRPGIRRHRAPRAWWRPVPVGRSAPLRGLAVRHARRPRALFHGHALTGHGPPRALSPLDPPGQAVQLDGLAGAGSTDRGRA
ncbi:MAG: hypothetical protein AUH44_00485 [Chloroflexi bacterium 13_1_40CM_68_15]|nr:MAG: hypothetical protein AUH44_00485 [Chloroflexi bacterium 13_1_40CM_68_15]